MERHEIAWLTGGLFALAAVLFSLVLIHNHLKHYTIPELQKYIVRILLMVPIYCVDSYLSLVFTDAAGYLDTARDCYEGYCLWSFFKLMTTYLEMQQGGREGMEHMLDAKPAFPHPFPMCMLHFKPSAKSLRTLAQGLLQFVIVKPLMALIALILHLCHHNGHDLYGEGDFSPRRGYLYVTIVNNTSISVALYCLVLFYMSVRDELAGFRPVPKFLCIKAVLFFSFWQSVVLAMLAHAGVITSTNTYTVKNVETSLQDFVICIEMFFAAWAHVYAFPYTEFVNENLPSSPLLMNWVDVIDPTDVLKDTQETFFRRGRSMRGSSDDDEGNEGSELLPPRRKRRGPVL